MGESPDKRVVPLAASRRDDELREEAREAIVRRFAWQKPAIVAFFVCVTGLAYWLVEEKREEDLREYVISGHKRVARHLEEPFEDLREKIAKLVTSEAGEYRGDFHDPIFRVARLADATGIYVRIPLGKAKRRRTLEKAARAQHRDAVTGCLGVEARMYGQVLLDGTMVSKEYGKKILRAQSQRRLRALGEDLTVRTERDIPNLAKHVRPDYLLAVLEEGHRAPRRAILWDVHTERLLLRTRDANVDVVIPVRWVGEGGSRATAKTDGTVANTAADCALATSIRRATGEEPSEEDTEPPAEEGTETESADAGP